MSRGFDPFDLDDFRDSRSDSDSKGDSYTFESFRFGREVGRGRGGGSSDFSTRLRLEKIREAESLSDRASTPGRDHHDMSRVERENQVSDDRNRTKFTDRDRSYSLRPSEIFTLTQIGTFRVVNEEDLARFAYAGDPSRLESDLRNLMRQGLLERRATGVFKKHSRQVLTLTKSGQGLLHQHELVPDDQAIYSGLVKPKEAEHDSDLYRLYQKAAEEIERKGGRIRRVQLDYELKERLYERLGRAQTRGEKQPQRLKETSARDMGLPVVHGKVSFPDLRIEYETRDTEIARVDLELATGHYHASHLAEKARAGFQIYARTEDAAGLRRVRDEREIMTSILSL